MKHLPNIFQLNQLLNFKIHFYNLKSTFLFLKIGPSSLSCNRKIMSIIIFMGTKWINPCLFNGSYFRIGIFSKRLSKIGGMSSRQPWRNGPTSGGSNSGQLASRARPRSIGPRHWTGSGWIGPKSLRASIFMAQSSPFLKL